MDAEILKNKTKTWCWVIEMQPLLNEGVDLNVSNLNPKEIGIS